VSCRCGHNIQTRSHVLDDCPLFARARRHLTVASEDLVIADLLGTKDGIQALVDYSSAFRKYLPLAQPHCIQWND
ncbi:hypothetical protein J3A83DRAFT_4088397, partial [Scleroderma citrinum]